MFKSLDLTVQNRSAIALLLGANAISGFAQGISMIAIPWYFAHVLNEEVFFGRSIAILTIITLFWSLLAGTIIDRYSRKLIFVVLNSVGFILLLSIALFGH